VLPLHGEIIEMDNVSKEEALQYLKLRKIDAEQGVQTYELVGGRMIYLKCVADKIEHGGTLQGICIV
jgi:hypothetical protein